MISYFRLGLSTILGVFLVAAVTPIPQAFIQEIPQHASSIHRLTGTIQLVEVLSDGTVQVYSGGMWWRREKERWDKLASIPVGTEERFHFPDLAGRALQIPVPAREVRQLFRFGTTNYLITARQLITVSPAGLRSIEIPESGQARQLAVSPQGELWLASTVGLHRWTGVAWEASRVTDSVGRVWTSGEVLGVAFDVQRRMWIATRAGVGRREQGQWTFFEGRDGLPWNDFTGVAAGEEGVVWFGTRLGAIRFNGQEWQYRQGARWLPSDEVVQVAVNAAGDAWFATPAGLGCIERRPYNLAAKADFYEQEIDRHLRRTPYGYVSSASLKAAGDKSSAQLEDDDNDGLWTAMYGAGECFAWAATRDPQAKQRAKKAFEALRFLQVVTQGGKPSPPSGYIARSIRSVQLPDPNIGRLEADRQTQAQHDTLWKIYEPRWPRSADGNWYWKGDTSSDELDGHYFLYAQYFELCADTPEEKGRVAEVVRGLTDHLVSHGFSLVDVDGKPTRWGFYGPETLNRDRYWWIERGINSLSMLSYLAVAEHVTGDPKYGAISRELVERHGYAQNAMVPKIQMGVGSGNQSDDEMSFMCFYNLLRFSKNEALKSQLRLAFHVLWALEEPEMNPFFNFAYAAVGLGQSITTQWGRFDLSPWPQWLEDSATTLRGMPLDRISWNAQNSHRLDVSRLPRQNSIDLISPDSKARGWRVNRKVVPVENRDFHHWNTDPWELDYSGSGHSLGSGAVFLLPYYMGLYHGFVQKP